MNETKAELAHSPEPWAIQAVDDMEGAFVVVDANGRSVAFFMEGSQIEANERRAVSCVNALHGVAEPEVALQEARAALAMANEQFAGDGQDRTPVAIKVREALAALPEEEKDGN